MISLILLTGFENISQYGLYLQSFFKVILWEVQFDIMTLFDIVRNLSILIKDFSKPAYE